MHAAPHLLLHCVPHRAERFLHHVVHGETKGFEQFGRWRAGAKVIKANEFTVVPPLPCATRTRMPLPPRRGLCRLFGSTDSRYASSLGIEQTPCTAC